MCSVDIAPHLLNVFVLFNIILSSLLSSQPSLFFNGLHFFLFICIGPCLSLSSLSIQNDCICFKIFVFVFLIVFLIWFLTYYLWFAIDELNFVIYFSIQFFHVLFLFLFINQKLNGFVHFLYLSLIIILSYFRLCLFQITNILTFLAILLQSD